MTHPAECHNPGSKIATSAAVVWVVAFLYFFFSQDLPNNSPDADQPLTRLDIWHDIARNWTAFLNPLDYSSGDDAGWQYFGQRLPFVGVALTLWLSAWCLGEAACGSVVSRIHLLTSERLVISLGTGVSLFTLWVLLCGLTGQMNMVPLLTPAAVSLILLCRRWWKGKSARTASGTLTRPVPDSADNRWLVAFCCLLGLPFVLHIFLGGMTPPFDFDVREYHLQGPKEWFQAGRMTTLEHNVYTSFPFLSEMLSLAAMILTGDWWTGAIAGKLTLAGFQLLSATCVFAICRRWFSRIAGLIAAVALLSTPWTVRISIIAYAEGALSFYLIATALVGLRAAATDDPAGRIRLFGLTGFLAGSAMASKYTGAVSVVVPVGLFLLAAALRSPSPTAGADESGGRAGRFIRTTAVFAVGVLLAVGPWLLKNAVTTGNPVYPLAWSVFGGSDWSPEMDEKWKRAHSPDDHKLEAIPIHLTDVVARNDWQNGFLFALAVPAWLLVRCRREVGWLWLLVIWTIVTWWAVTHRIDRFWIPVIPVLAVLAGAAWHVGRSRLWHFTVVAALAVCWVFNAGLCRPEIINRHIIGFHAGLMELEAARALPIRRDIRLLNSTLPEDARVLMIGEAEVFDADFDLVYSTVFDSNIFEQWTSRQDEPTVPPRERQMKSADEIRAILRQQKITHLFVNWSEILRYRLTYGYTGYVHPERFRRLQQMQILQPPISMGMREWDGCSDQEQREILSWPGGDSLMTEDRFWASLQLFRVTAE
ncbi:MAG: glycosyltransferase family 39 protein [Fuerstiella sp.]